MYISSPRISIFGQRQKAQQSNALPQSAQATALPRPDTFSRQASPVSPVFAGHPKDHNEQLYNQFPKNFQSVIRLAIDKATQNGEPQVNAEHLVWAAIQTLDDLAGWETAPGRHSRASDRESKEQAEMLAQALLPNHPNVTPTQAIKILRPLGEEIARDFNQDMMDLEQSANLNLQRGLQSAMKSAIRTEEDGTEASPQALFRKILWQRPPVPSFSTLSGTAQRLIRTPQITPPDTPTDGQSVSEEESIGEASKSLAEWKQFQANLQEKSPGLAKWVNSSAKQLNNPIYQGIPLRPLHHIVANGIDQAQRELNPNGKRRQPTETERNLPFKNSLQSLLPNLKDGPPAHRQFMTSILDKYRKTLQSMPMPQNPTQAAEQADHSRQVIEQFLEDPNRDEYSLKSFVEHLKDTEAAEAPGAPNEYAAVGKVLTRMHEEALDNRTPLMEQFEKTVPALIKHGTNMVRQGINKQLPEVLLRRQATDSMLAILGSGGTRTNILLNAASGEGKTYAVQGLAQRFADNDVPPALKGAQMVQLNLGSLVANASIQGELEGRVEDIFRQLNKYLTENPTRQVVLFVDEFHMLGDMLDTMKASGILEKKNLSFVGATTPDDWRKSALKGDQAFQGRFQELSLPSFSKSEKLAILGRTSTKLAEKNGVDISPEIMELALDQTISKWPENSLRRATDLLGLSISLAKSSTLEQASLKDQLQLKQLWLDTLKNQKDLQGRFARQMQEAQDDIQKLTHQIKTLGNITQSKHPQVEDKHIRQALAILTGERIGTLSEGELDKLHHAKEILGREIIGQDEALEAAQQCLRKIAVHQKTGSTRKTPVASMLLCGPTGVGKTELSKVIAREFMNNNFMRIDMGEYKEKHEVSKLLGSPPGYVGHENGGLIDKIRKTPNMVLVFDEIEKAHEDIYDSLLSILAEGEARDNQGQIVNFRDAIVIMTSNLNNQQITKLITQTRNDPAKRKDPALTARELERQVRAMLVKPEDSTNKGFKPELLERLDAVIPFSPLSKRSVSAIIDLRLREMNQAPFLKNNNLSVELSDKARARLIDLSAAGSKPKLEQHPTTAPNPAGRGGARKRPEATDDNTFLPGGARSVGKTFERFIHDTVFTNLTFEPHMKGLVNTQLVVDYDPSRQEFTLKQKASLPFRRKSSDAMQIDSISSSRTLTFA